MSKKTDNIYKTIETLNSLQLSLEDISVNLVCDGDEKQKIDDIQFQMKQNLRELKFWIDSLYSYNGKSTSRAKQNSSRANGKKGGRPPKEITEVKRRLVQLNELIPELEHKLKMEDDFAEAEKIKMELNLLNDERIKIEEKLSKWLESKKNGQ